LKTWSSLTPVIFSDCASHHLEFQEGGLAKESGAQEVLGILHQFYGQAPLQAHWVVGVLVPGALAPGALGEAMAR